MKYFCVTLLFFTTGLVYGASGDYSEQAFPSNEIRNRAPRTMRVNMRVGKRYGEYDEDELKLDTDDTSLRQSQATPEQQLFENRPITAPKRRLRFIVRTGKRGFDYANPVLTQELTGKRYFENRDYENTSLPPHFHTESNYEEAPDQKFKDFKRSAPQFLLNPRVGKMDKTWKILNRIQKRNDQMPSKFLFAPRIGRMDQEKNDDALWNYLVLNGNSLARFPLQKNKETDGPEIEDPEE